MRNFELHRTEDPSGISGTGVVAEIVEFSNGKCCVAWDGTLAGVASVIVYDSLGDVERIHGHEGRSVIVEVQGG